MVIYIKYLALFLIATIPIIIMTSIIYFLDKEKEPKKLLILLFGSGILACILSSLTITKLGNLFPILSTETSYLNNIELMFSVFVGTALIEELSKWIMTYFISYNNKYFDELYDMVVYSAFVALGFAYIENLFYVFNTGIITGLYRGILAVPCHACTGIFMGYYLGISKLHSLLNDKKNMLKYVLLSIIYPILIHGIYDYCLLTNNALFLVIFQAFVIIMYNYSLKKVRRLLKVNKKLKINKKRHN